MNATSIQSDPSGVFNLAQFEAADTALLIVQNQKDDGPLLYNGQPVTIELCGPGSEEYVKAQAEIDRQNTERLMQSVRGKTPKDAAAEARAATIKKLVACTRSVNNFPIPGGARALYENPKLGFITDQAAKFHTDWANFPAASTTS